jgi:hypothetical protein
MQSLHSLIIQVPSLVYPYHFCIWKLYIDFQREDRQAVPKVEKSTEKSPDTVPGLHIWTCLCAEITNEMRKNMKTNEDEKIWGEESKTVKTRKKGRKKR